MTYHTNNKRDNEQLPESGQSLIEYALILVLVAIAFGVALAATGPAISNVFSNTVYNLLGQAPDDTRTASSPGDFWLTVTWAAENPLRERALPTRTLVPATPVPTDGPPPPDTEVPDPKPTVPTNTPPPTPTMSDLSFQAPWRDTADNPEWYRLGSPPFIGSADWLGEYFEGTQLDYNGAPRYQLRSNGNLYGPDANTKLDFPDTDYDTWKNDDSGPLSDWPPANPYEQFSVRFTRPIYLENEETLSFSVDSDDGVRLWLLEDGESANDCFSTANGGDGTVSGGPPQSGAGNVYGESSSYPDGCLLIDDWQDQSMGSTLSVTRTIAAGSYTLQVDYYENTGDAGLSLDINAIAGSNPDDKAVNVNNTSYSPTSGEPGCNWGRREGNDANSLNALWDEYVGGDMPNDSLCYLELRGYVEIPAPGSDNPIEQPQFIFWDVWDMDYPTQRGWLEVAEYVPQSGGGDGELAVDRDSLDWKRYSGFQRSGGDYNYNWTRNVIDLESSFPSLDFSTDTKLTFRFAMINGSDGGRRDWYIDDVQIVDGADNDFSDKTIGLDDDVRAEYNFSTVDQADQFTTSGQWELTRNNVAPDNTQINPFNGYSWELNPGANYTEFSSAPTSPDPATTDPTNYNYDDMRIHYVQLEPYVSLSALPGSDGAEPMLSFWHGYELADRAGLEVQYREDENSAWKVIPGEQADDPGGRIIDVGDNEFTSDTEVNKNEEMMRQVDVSLDHLPDAVDTFQIRFAMLAHNARQSSDLGEGWWIDNIKLHRDDTIEFVDYSFNDGAEDGLDNWRTGGTWWVTTERARSGFDAFTDSPLSEYAANSGGSESGNDLRLAGPIDFNNDTPANVDNGGNTDGAAVDPVMSFWHQRMLEGGDNFYVEWRRADEDETQWKTLWAYRDQMTVDPGDTDSSTRDNENWEYIEIDLRPVTSTFTDDTSNTEDDVIFRFRLETNGGGEDDGIYIDDVQIRERETELVHKLWPVSDDGTVSGTFPECDIAPPVSEYTFDGNANDSRGSYDGMLVGELQYVSGYSGDALSFEGSSDGNINDDYVDLGENTFAGPGEPFDDDSPAFTVSMWVNPANLRSEDTNHSTQNVIFANASDDNNDNVEIGLNEDGGVDFYVDSEDRDGNGDTIGSQPWSTGTWYHIVAVFDNGQRRVYIDGISAGSIADVGTDNLDNGAEGSPVTIGNSMHVETPFEGSIDEVRIYNQPLDQDDVTRLYDWYEGNSSSCSGLSFGAGNGETFVADGESLNWEDNWFLNGSWERISFEQRNGLYAFHESATDENGSTQSGAKYLENDATVSVNGDSFNVLRLNRIIDLRATDVSDKPTMYFWSRYDTDTQDEIDVQISYELRQGEDYAGSLEAHMATRCNNQGSQCYQQDYGWSQWYTPADEAISESFATESNYPETYTWQRFQVDLSSIAGENLAAFGGAPGRRIRVRFVYDALDNGDNSGQDGWYIDNVSFRRLDDTTVATIEDEPFFDGAANMVNWIGEGKWGLTAKYGRDESTSMLGSTWQEYWWSCTDCDDFLDNDPALSSADAQREVLDINYDLGENTPPPVSGFDETDNYTARWILETPVIGPTSGVDARTYTFTTESDDGVRFKYEEIDADGNVVDPVNSWNILENWSTHATETDMGTATLEAGKRYRFTLEYFEATSDSVITLTLEGSSGFSFTDSPAQGSNLADVEAVPQGNSSLLLDGTFDLTGTNQPVLEYYTFYDVDSGSTARVEVSTDGGFSWTEEGLDDRQLISGDETLAFNLNDFERETSEDCSANDNDADVSNGRYVMDGDDTVNERDGGYPEKTFLVHFTTETPLSYDEDVTDVDNESIDVNERQIIFEQGGGSNGLAVFIDGGYLYGSMWSETNDWDYAYGRIDLPDNTPTEYVVALTLGNGEFKMYYDDTPDSLDMTSVSTTLLDAGNDPITTLAEHPDDSGLGGLNGSSKLFDTSDDSPDGVSGSDILAFGGVLFQMVEWNRELSVDDINQLTDGTSNNDNPELGACFGNTFDSDFDDPSWSGIDNVPYEGDDWELRRHNLEAYEEQQLMLRFRLDRIGEENPDDDGWWLTDIQFGNSG